VLCTDSAEETLNLAKTENFDLYLMDNWCRRSPDQSSQQKFGEFDTTTPILFYSGAAYESGIQDAQRAGAQAYLVNPAAN
jgi:DNA-binding NarL/FixJ family response regulator